MRNQRDLAPNRYTTIKTSGSNKFVSSFLQKGLTEGIVEKRNSTYNWVSYKWSLLFSIIVGILTYFVIDYWMF